MKNTLSAYIVMTLFVLAGCRSWENEFSTDSVAFQEWLANFKSDARSKGFEDDFLDRVFAKVKLDQRVIRADQYQPESISTFRDYITRLVSTERVDEGRYQLQKHAHILKKLEHKYGIPPSYIMAFWGAETNYGKNQGSYQVIDSLTTLAYEGRRGDFFRAQLMEALDILSQRHITQEKFRGSWAGAMGHMQFIPSTFMVYAVDGDGDGRKDIWGNLPDAFTSAAAYLNKMGWRRGMPWGYEVTLPKNFSYVGLNSKKTLLEWEKIGVRPINKNNFPPHERQEQGTLLLPDGAKGPAFIGMDNFHVMMKWNRSHLYIIAVGHLADRLRGGPSLRKLGSGSSLSMEEVKALQEFLSDEDYYEGEIDGIIGSRMRQGVSDYQKDHNLPADGHVGRDLYNHIF